MLSPSHVQILVGRARGLKIKGKNGTNDVYATLELGKEKIQTSVLEKTESPSWNEEFSLKIPDTSHKQGEVTVKILHRNFMGSDDFLGLTSLCLSDFDVYEKPKTRWYSLSSKPGRSKSSNRGEIELRLSFSVTGSLANDRSSMIGEANTDSIEPGWLDTNDDTGVVSEVEDDILDEMLDELDAITPVHSPSQQQTSENILKNILDRAAGSSKEETNHADEIDNHLVPSNTQTIPKLEDTAGVEQNVYTNHSSSTPPEELTDTEYQHQLLSLPQLQSSNVDKRIGKNHMAEDEGYFSRKVSVESTLSSCSDESGVGQRVVLGRETSPEPDTVSSSSSDDLASSASSCSNVPEEILQRFQGQSREDLIEMVCFLQRAVESQGKKLADLEDYIDSMVLRVMEKAPNILDNNMEYYYNLYKRQ